jgi:hypothetical protein
MASQAANAHMIERKMERIHTHTHTHTHTHPHTHTHTHSHTHTKKKQKEAFQSNSPTSFLLSRGSRLQKPPQKHNHEKLKDTHTHPLTHDSLYKHVHTHTLSFYTHTHTNTLTNFTVLFLRADTNQVCIQLLKDVRYSLSLSLFPSLSLSSLSSLSLPLNHKTCNLDGHMKSALTF